MKSIANISASPMAPMMVPLNAAQSPAKQASAAQGTEVPVHKNRFSVSRTAGTMPVWKPTPATVTYAEDGVTPVATINNNTPGFKDMLDVINPLQHIPIVSTIYRKLTGDEISAPARVIGDTVFGGPIGGALGLADVAIKAQTGSTVGEKALKLVSSDSEKETSSTSVAHLSQNTSRTAGTMPVWGARVSPDTHFAAMIEGVSGQKPNIS